MEIEITIASVILLLMVFLATIDLAFSYLSDVSLRRLAADVEAEKQIGAAHFLREILENRPRFRFAISSTGQILMISFAVLLTLIVFEFTNDRLTLLLAALVLGLSVTVIGRQIIPRLLIRENTEKKLLFLLPAVRPLYSIATAISAPFVARAVAKEEQRLEMSVAPDSSDERDEDKDDDFQALMDVGAAEGIIEEKERELIETMVEFSDTRAGEIMTPRTEICALPLNSTIKDARDLIIEEKYSRIPVYRDTIDNIEGMVYVRDLLQLWAEGKEDQPVSEILREAYFVPETKTAAELLQYMQLNHVQIAIVIDEYGGVAGLITAEDILEEIVGEIEDEDTGREEIIEIIEGEDGYFEVVGSTEIDNIERLFDMELEDDDYTTIAGLVTSESGYVPKVGEKLYLRGLEVEILRADEKKLQLLKIRKASENEEDRIDDEVDD
jgi:magnesium and cobalt exporter, CNNM family